MRRWNLTTKIIAGLSLAILFGLVLFTSPHAIPVAHAEIDLGAATRNYDVDVNYGSCDVTEIGCNLRIALQKTILFLLLIIGRFFAIILNIGASATKAMMNAGVNIMEMPIITAGFKVTQSLTNLLFVLAIIIMAFATIFQIEAYSAKRLLKSLIIGAVLVNFSFLIASALIDVSNVFTNFFIRGVTPEKIGSAFNPQSLLSPAKPSDFGIESADDTKGDAFSGIRAVGTNADGTKRYQFQVNEGSRGWETWFKIIQGVLLADVMTILLSVIMMALAIMVLTRNIWLAILIMFMPLIWGLHVIPKLSEHWDKWWTNFIKWVIYLPTVTFIVFLAITTTEVTAVSGGLFGKDLVVNIIQMLILCGILVAAMKAGKGAGVVGAGLAFGVGGFIARGALGLSKSTLSAGTQIAGKTVEFAGKGKYNPLKYAGVGLAGKGIAKAGNWIGKAGNKSLETGKFQAPNIDPNKGIGWITGLTDKSDKTGKIQQAASKHRSEHLKDLGPDELIKEANHPHAGGGVAEKLAMLQQLSDKDALGSDKITNDRMLELLEAAKTAGATEAYSSAKKKMMLSRPDMMAALSKTDDEFMEKNKLTAQSTDDEIVLAQIRTMKNEDLAKIRFDKMSAPAQKELAEKYTKNRTILSKRLPDAGDEETKAMLTAFDQQVSDIGTLLNTAAAGGGGTGGKKNWNEVLKNYGLADARTELENQLKALRASRGVAGANTAEIDKQVGLIQDLSRSVEAWHRTNQSPGSVV